MSLSVRMSVCSLTSPKRLCDDSPYGTDSFTLKNPDSVNRSPANSSRNGDIGYYHFSSDVTKDHYNNVVVQPLELSYL